MQKQDLPFFIGHWTSGAKGPGGMRNDFAGDVGFSFVPKIPLLVSALGRQLGVGRQQLHECASVTLWCAHTETALAIACIGPEESIEQGYVYGELGSGVRLEAGREYRISQQCVGGMSDYWFDGVVAPSALDSSPAMRHVEFRGSVYCNGCGFPNCSDEDGRFPTQHRRVGMLNFKMRDPYGVDLKMPPRQNLPSSRLPSEGTLAIPVAHVFGSPTISAPLKGSDQLVVQLVCMSSPPE